MTPEEVQAEREFWDRWIRRPDGTLNEDALYAELADYRTILGEVPTVYSAVTCGAISKPNTRAKAVVEVAAECLDRGIREALTEVYNSVQAGDTLENALSDYDVFPGDPR